MKRKLYIYITALMTISACQDQLDIVNPNQPTPENARTEQGIIALAQGGLYINAFQESKFGGNHFELVLGGHECMGDVIGLSFNNYFLGCPDSIRLDNGKKLHSVNENGQRGYLREVNGPSSQANPLYFEWAFMYSLNNTMNIVLANVDQIPLSKGKSSSIKAWTYFWKGFAYSRIGSMYYSAIINDEPNKTNGLYVTKEQILKEAENNFDKAESLLHSLGGDPDYVTVLDALIPSVCKAAGKGGILTTDEWVRNINTMRARNILVNTPTDEMTADMWNEVLDLCTSGVRETDNTFTMRTDDLGNLLQYFVAGETAGTPSDGGQYYKVSERLIQDFKSGDLRLSNNFEQISPWVAEKDRGTSVNTRYILIDGGNGIPGVTVMCNRGIGEQELYIAGSYEENLLMLAEANINTGKLDEGLVLIDELRSYQGAGLDPVAGTGMTLPQAKEELRSERRVALAFRGFSFYDARRWGILKSGRAGSVVVDFDGNVSTNATISYGFLDYWDVPIAELFYNPQEPGSALVVNPDN